MTTSDKGDPSADEPMPAVNPRLAVWRILVADDDPDAVDLLQRALAGPTIEIVAASSGAELLQLVAEQGPFELIVTDIQMPWMEGLQVLLSVRAAKIQTPALVITGLSRPGLEAKVARLGHARLLQKPFGIGELRRAVVAMLGGTSYL